MYLDDHWCRRCACQLQLVPVAGTVLLCLHEWGVHEHRSLTSPESVKPGNGLLLFFRVDDFDQALQRVRALANRLEEEPQMNPSTGTAELSLEIPMAITSQSVPSMRPNPSLLPRN